MTATPLGQQSHQNCCNVLAALGGLPYQCPIQADSLESQRLIEGDSRPIEVVHKKGNAAPFPRQVAADLAQQRSPEAMPTVSGVRPYPHELYRLGSKGGVLALGDDFSALKPDERALLVDELANPLAIA